MKTIDPEAVCREISGELKEIATWLADGRMSAPQLAATISALEERKVKRFGLTLHARVSEDDHALFSLRYAGTGELCASMNIDAETGEIVMQPACCPR